VSLVSLSHNFIIRLFNIAVGDLAFSFTLIGIIHSHRSILIRIKTSLIDPGASAGIEISASIRCPNTVSRHIVKLLPCGLNVIALIFIGIVTPISVLFLSERELKIIIVVIR
jgi:hypothetical protein